MLTALIPALALALVGSLGAPVMPMAQAQQAPSKAVWLRQVAVVMEPSLEFLDERVGQGDDRLAVVLDIDNTSIATHYAWPRPVRKTRAFARKAEQLGVKVFFVTGRKGADAQARRATLLKAGYPVDGICGRRSGEGLVESKSRCRKAYHRKGFTIIASVGNRATDFKGPYVARVFDLPDYGGALS